MTRKSDHIGILRRGSACLSCRRRKLRCDGVRPVCSPCNSMKRPHECKYDDSGRKSRTQTLREKLSVLEAKVRELESSSVQSPPPTSIWTPKPFSDYSPHVESPLTQQSDAFWDPNMNIHSMYSTMEGFPLQYNSMETPLDFSSGSSSSSDASISRSLGITIPSTISGIISPLALTDSSGTPLQESVSEQMMGVGSPSPSVSISQEMHETLIRTFIMHKKQCCFYSNTCRFDLSTSSAMYQNPPPNPALMSAIYLLGSFFARFSQLERQMLERTLHDVSLSVQSSHNQEQPMDMVQALCLLAQYFFFNDRDMEGNRHLSVAKRIAFDYGLHQLSPAAFSFESAYTFDGTSQDLLEKSTVFWQMFMVNNFWSASNDYCVGSPAVDKPCRHITTPLPVDEKYPAELVAGNSPLHALFDCDVDFIAKSKSLTSFTFKVMASTIFDRSLRVHNTILKDEMTWAYRRSAEVALERLTELLQPITRDDTSYSDRSCVNTDLYAVDSLIVASLIHLHVDNNIMDLKISQAARKVVELVNNLTDDDYQYLDPVLSVCWSSIVKVFRRIMDAVNEKILSGAAAGPASFTLTFLQSCVNVLLLALQKMGNFIPLADSLLKNLENTHSPLHSGLSKVLPPYEFSMGHGDYNIPVFAIS